MCKYWSKWLLKWGCSHSQCWWGTELVLGAIDDHEFLMSVFKRYVWLTRDSSLLSLYLNVSSLPEGPFVITIDFRFEAGITWPHEKMESFDSGTVGNNWEITSDILKKRDIKIFNRRKRKGDLQVTLSHQPKSHTVHYVKLYQNEQLGSGVDIWRI